MLVMLHCGSAIGFYQGVRLTLWTGIQVMHNFTSSEAFPSSNVVIPLRQMLEHFINASKLLKYMMIEMCDLLLNIVRVCVTLYRIP